jgi:hypothetical protein
MKRRDILKTFGAAGAASLLDRSGFGGERVPAPRVKPAEVLIDHYAWYRLPWSKHVYTDPLRGHYDSGDIQVVERQNEEKNFFSIPVDCVSWWGPTSASYLLFQQAYLKAANFASRKFCFLYEITGRLRQSRVLDSPPGAAGGPSFAPSGRPVDAEWKKKYYFDFRDPYNRETFLADIDYLEANHFNAENYHRIDGRPVLYIWLDNLKYFDAASAKARKKVYLIGSEPIFFPPERWETDRFTRPNWYDAITCYGMNPVYVAKTWGSLKDGFRAEYVRMVRTWVSLLKTYAPNTQLLLPVQFTFHDGNGNIDPKDGKSRVLVCQQDEGEAFVQQVKALFDEVPRIRGVHLTSYNEHYEGSAFEPSVFEGMNGQKIGYGSRWLALIKKYFKANITA